MTPCFSPEIEYAVRAAILPRIASSRELDSVSQAPTGATLANAISEYPLHSTSLSGDNKSIADYSVKLNSLKKLQDFLLNGEKRKAFHFALDEKLWAHALVIASSVDKDAFKEVVSEFVQSELGMHQPIQSTKNDGTKNLTNGLESLRLAYSLYSGQSSAAGRSAFYEVHQIPNFKFSTVQQLVPSRLFNGQTLPRGPSLTLQPPTPLSNLTPMTPSFPIPNHVAPSVPPELFTNWQEYAVMLYSGQMMPDSSAALTALGDYLINNDWIEAGHCCYLLSPKTSPMAGLGTPSVRVVLLGSQLPPKSPNFHKNIDSIILSEIEEFALSLRTPVKGQEPFGGLPHLQAFRLFRAQRLAELGHVPLAKRYSFFLALKSIPLTMK